ncbi:hypothetical protein PILCRDRAFT_827261 [Piloderma croceum F 1598]|uniref:30S ribosomal protein S17 n=1 Tax=Piloderma croceum (strain F 1598) TaxID=765440 RepID=A0A0C3AN79_PILCF|nr:hypothetical protein PILCRDRAFT_827261 [Piloderma croceum F 1598]
MGAMAFVGVVTKVGVMNKTATVTVPRLVIHKRTGKRLERSTKILTHDENNELRIEDTVLIRHTRPISARKRFILEKILKSPIGEAAAITAAQTNPPLPPAVLSPS